MDYTVSLQVQHQLAVFPTHFYQSYTVELQVHLCYVAPAGPVSFFSPLFFCSVHDQRRAWVQRSEGDFEETLYCRGNAWPSCCMLMFFSSPRLLLRSGGGGGGGGGSLRGNARGEESERSRPEQVELTSREQVPHVDARRVGDGEVGRRASGTRGSGVGGRGPLRGDQT